jgi:hypothetical protein
LAVAGAGREEAARLGIEERRHPEVETPRLVEMVDQYDVREAIKVGEAVGVLRCDLHGPAHASAPRGLDRHALSLFERGVDEADGLVLDLHLFFWPFMKR